MIKKPRLAITIVIVITLILTVAGVLIALNFTSGEKNVERKLPRLYQTIFDTTFASRQTKVFEDDLSRAKRMTFEAWSNRPWQEKLKERLALLFESQL